MGAAASAALPEAIDNETGRQLCGEYWDGAAFDAMASEGTITKEQFEEALERHIDAEAAKVKGEGAFPALSTTFKEHGSLGQGAFGEVMLVSRVGEEESKWAMKRVTKTDYAEEDKGVVDQIQQEILILKQLGDHPFVVPLVAWEESDSEICLLLEYMACGELWTVMANHQQASGTGLPHAEAQFHLGCVLTGLEFLHTNDIVHRDLKPENVLLDRQGYARLADFGTAKAIPAGEKSLTLRGTPQYMAPELFMQTGHDRGIDLWAFGILLHEGTHTVLSYSPLIHSSHTLLSYTPVIHSSHTLLSYTPPIHSSHTVLSYSPVIHSSHTLSHTLLSYTLSCTPFMHSFYQFY
jgi:serine/threonine protein kinase